ncbi:MAG: entericidin A/B family lipoprotein [Rhodobacteraceae bacterium]|nr:entericidin A/B family lipoprotein [Paracoccaceae bacterium]
MKPLLLVLILTAIAALSGCETVEGAGRDIQAAGHAVSSTARQVQSEL